MRQRMSVRAQLWTLIDGTKRVMLLGKAADSMSACLNRAEAQGLWLTPSSHAEEVLLRRRLAKGELASPFRGMYGRRDAFETASVRERAIRTIRTLGLLHPNWVFCGYSAAVVHGLQVPNTVLDAVHYCANGRNRRESPLVRHRLQLAPQDTVSNMGVRVTSLRKTLVDCLCASDFRVGLAIADSAIHWELASKREIANWIEEDGRGRRGVRQARQTIAWADGRSENGGESIARATMIELGFVAPLLQVEVFDPMEPDNPKRGDFGWRLEDGSWVIGELDGIGKYRKDDVNGTRNGLDAAIRALAAERRRESHLCLSGSKVVRFGMRDVLDTAYFERLLTAAGVPRREEPSD